MIHIYHLGRVCVNKSTTFRDFLEINILLSVREITTDIWKLALSHYCYVYSLCTYFSKKWLKWLVWQTYNISTDFRIEYNVDLSNKLNRIQFVYNIYFLETIIPETARSLIYDHLYLSHRKIIYDMKHYLCIHLSNISTCTSWLWLKIGGSVPRYTIAY